MSIIAVFSAPANSLSLGQCIENQPGTEIEIERVVPMREGTFPYIFVWNCTNYELFEETVKSLPEVTAISIIEKFDNGRLYKLGWDQQEHKLISNAVRNDGVLLFARGDSVKWRFEFRFPNRANVSQFFSDVSNDLIEFELTSLFEEIEYQSMEDESLLTNQQKNALKTALEMGYFNTPRDASLGDVATELDISASACSVLLRRGHKQLLNRRFEK
jgi:predicted DNA binding protein